MKMIQGKFGGRSFFMWIKILDENDTGKIWRAFRLYLEIRSGMKMLLGKFGKRSVFIWM